MLLLILLFLRNTFSRLKSILDFNSAYDFFKMPLALNSRKFLKHNNCNFIISENLSVKMKILYEKQSGARLNMRVMS